MITLKLATYTKEESETLAQILWNARYELEHYKCPTPRNCETCTYRHLCIDLTQAHMYAKEYTPTRNNTN